MWARYGSEFASNQKMFCSGLARYKYTSSRTETHLREKESVTLQQRLPCRPRSLPQSLLVCFPHRLCCTLSKGLRWRQFGEAVGSDQAAQARVRSVRRSGITDRTRCLMILTMKRYPWIIESSVIIATSNGLTSLRRLAKRREYYF